MFKCEASERGGTTGIGVDVTASAVDATGLEAVAVDDGAALSCGSADGALIPGDGDALGAGVRNCGLGLVRWRGLGLDCDSGLNCGLGLDCSLGLGCGSGSIRDSGLAGCGSGSIRDSGSGCDFSSDSMGEGLDGSEGNAGTSMPTIVGRAIGSEGADTKDRLPSIPRCASTTAPNPNHSRPTGSS